MLNTLLLSIVSLANGSRAANIAGALNSVDAQASNVQSLINQWSSDNGLQGALSIQDQFPALSNAVASLSQAAGSVSDEAIDPSAVKSLASSISSLLQALAQKATDFKGVGASDIVANDISSLKQPAVDIINNFAKAVSQNCEKAGSLSPALHDIAQGFSSADANYNLPSANFPNSIACAGNKDAGSAPQQNNPPAASTAAGRDNGGENGAGYPSALPQHPGPPSPSHPGGYPQIGGAEPSVGLQGPSMAPSGNIYPYANPSMAAMPGNGTIPVVPSNSGNCYHASMIAVAIGLLSLSATFVL